MNVANLILQLKSKITDNTLDQQMISKAIKLLELGAVIQVDVFSQLPNASENAGKLYYVLFDGLYWSTGEFWVPIVKTSLDAAWSWGCNVDGRLGDGTNTDRSSPVPVVAFTDWCQVSAGGGHSLGLRQNGTAWAWGNNGSGRLGDGTGTTRSSPVLVLGGFTDWCQVSAGNSHSLGVRANGTAWAWGSNANGRLGDATTTGRNSPVSVVGGFTDWCQVSAGSSHSLGVRENGTAWGWGSNSYFGATGDGTTNTDRSSPVSVIGGFTDWCFVAAIHRHSLAIRSNGTMWAWGANGSGQLGSGLSGAQLSPVSVVGGFTDWCQAGGGGFFSLGLRSNGSLWAWGNNGQGRLGDGTTTNRGSPVSVVGGFTDWCQISTIPEFSGNHSVGLRQNGTLWAWGSNNSGQLGDGTTTDRSSPVSVVGGFTDWCQVSAAIQHSLAIRKIES
jgi:alpha-tubulin suppressor-like RCC1 family protein